VNKAGWYTRELPRRPSFFEGVTTMNTTLIKSLFVGFLSTVALTGCVADPTSDAEIDSEDVDSTEDALKTKLSRPLEACGEVTQEARRAQRYGTEVPERMQGARAFPAALEGPPLRPPPGALGIRLAPAAPSPSPETVPLFAQPGLCAGGAFHPDTLLLTPNSQLREASVLFASLW
jgi:hypothetical protein